MSAAADDDVDRDAEVLAGQATRRPGRTRSVVASILGVLAVLILVVGVIGVWAKATVLRPEPVAALVGDALAEPDVQAALAALLAEQVQEAVDLEDRVVGLLPDGLDRFAAPITAGATAAVERAIERILAEPAVQDIVTTIVERAHGRALDLLRGDGLVDGVTVVDGAVTVNLLPLVARGVTALQGLGLLEGVEVPQLTRDGDPEEQAAALSDALGRPLPDGFGQLTVYDSETVANAQDAVQTAQRLLVLAERAVWLIVLLAAVLVAATILVAPRRGRAVLVLAIGTAATMVVLRTVIRRVVADAEDIAPRPGGKAAIRAIVGGAGESLLRVAGVVLLVALVATVVAVVVRRRWRDDIVVAGAVLLGATTVALVGATIWGLVIGIAVGVAVPFVARRLLPPPTTDLGATGSPDTTLGDHRLPGDVAPPATAG